MHPHTSPEEFEPPTTDQPIIDREDQRHALQNWFTRSVPDHLHIYGPRGTGKTALTRTILEPRPRGTTGHYLSCIQYDTQYKVLRHLCNTVLDSHVSSGYHTSQLQRCLTERWTPDDVILILDEIDFLLRNDGNDLLYYLSRQFPDGLRLVLISANHPDLTTEIDDRTHSTLHPRRIQFDPYTETDAAQILANRARNIQRDTDLADGALTAITSTTTNIRLALHWLATALDADHDTVTRDHVDAVKEDAIDRYHDTLLADFTTHHDRLLTAITDLAAATDSLRSGTVYREYQDRCRAADDSPLTVRRISTFLKHLELLGIITSRYHYGGKKGKTREINLQQF